MAQGAGAVFHVVADGSPALRFQWQRNGIDVAGATYEWLFLPATGAGDDGARYHVVVSNASGSVTSNDAVLTVLGQ